MEWIHPTSNFYPSSTKRHFDMIVLASARVGEQLFVVSIGGRMLARRTRQRAFTRYWETECGRCVWQLLATLQSSGASQKS